MNKHQWLRAVPRGDTEEVTLISVVKVSERVMHLEHSSTWECNLKYVHCFHMYLLEQGVNSCRQIFMVCATSKLITLNSNAQGFAYHLHIAQNFHVSNLRSPIILVPFHLAQASKLVAMWWSVDHDYVPSLMWNKFLLYTFFQALTGCGHQILVTRSLSSK